MFICKKNAVAAIVTILLTGTSVSLYAHDNEEYDNDESEGYELEKEGKEKKDKKEKEDKGKEKDKKDKDDDDDDDDDDEVDDGTFEFALIADIPYNVAPGEIYSPLDNMIAEINSNENIEWVMHAGDLKSGTSDCSDALFYDRFDRFSQFNKPFIITPGDNDWTDCYRSGYLPLDRLTIFREVFYPNPGMTLGQNPMQVATQSAEAGFEEFPENVLWSEKSIVFSSIHAVGSKNGREKFDLRTDADDDEVNRRIVANVAWLDKTFAKALELDSPGVFIMIHANPGLERISTGVNRNGHVEFLTALEVHTKAFGKPVILAHGDSHYFRIDKPGLVVSNFVKNFTRVEAFGSPRANWLKIVVEPETDQVFTIYQELVE